MQPTKQEKQQKYGGVWSSVTGRKMLRKMLIMLSKNKINKWD